ncbi:MAG: Ig-like domain-containing protein, partial [Deltaproteobacteria bacterium]|nr:Ig-like domain-containing protein [Deltaproteobacteria bacterium]
MSRSSDLIVVEDQIRCGPVARRGREPSLDTVSVEHLGARPFDPFAISGALLVWGPETEIAQTPVDAARSDFTYSADLINGTREPLSVIATVASRSPEVQIIDDTVTGRVAGEKRLAAVDGFTLRHDPARAYDPGALVWRLRLAARDEAADFDGSGAVDEQDVSQIGACRGSDPARSCECAHADLDGDGAIDAADVGLAAAQLGRSGLPVRTPDTTPPVVTLSSPAPASPPGVAPISASGTASEPLFRLLVNGVDAVVEEGDPPLRWSAQVPLPSGAPILVTKAIDRACNVETTSVPLGAGVDGVAPQVHVVAPAKVGAGRALRVVADARDDVGATSVELFIDGATAGVRTLAPFVFDVVAPATPGATLALRALARDAAGNAGEGSATVLVIGDGPDAAPSVGPLRLPPSVAPGTRFLAGAVASDDRGVAEVRFAIAGGAGASALISPYQVELMAPADALPGERLSVTVDAIDGAGQATRASGTIAIVAQADRTLPRVTLEAPEEAAPGAEVLLTASADDDTGVAWVLFYRDGVLLVQGVSPPHELRVTMPAGRAPGEIVVWTAVAADFAGNTGTLVAAATRVVERAVGVVSGEVYDDATGRPLAGARVRATLAGGAPAPQAAILEATSDERGAYRIALPQGRALLEITRDGYTSAWRATEAPAHGVATPLDARLAPRAPPVEFERALGGTIEAAGGEARLVVPPGALAEGGVLGLTRLGPQALPLPLPPGWTPLAAFEVTASGAGLAAPASLALVDPALAGAALAAHLDAAAGLWRRVAIDDAAGGAPGLAVGAAGVVVLARPDAAPTAPPLPPVGATLIGVAPVEIPAAASATLLPAPRVIFPAEGARADVTARLSTPLPLPSGTPIEVRFRERYAQSDGSRLEPPPSDQDFLLFAEPEGPAARFVASPPPGLDPALLAEGAIELVARARPAAAPQLVGVAGGSVATPDGVEIEIARGALGEDRPVFAERLTPPALGLPDDDRYELLGGVDIDLGGAALAASAVLRFAVPESSVAGGQTLLLRQIDVLGRTELELAGVATPSGDAVLVGAGGAGLPLPGIRAGGRYLLVRLREAAGFVTGSVTRGGAPAPGALVRADTLPFVSRTRAGDARYAVAARAGTANVDGLDLASGDAAMGEATLAPGGAVAVRDLALLPRPLAVLEVDPPGGSVDVAVARSVTLRFSAPIDAASIDAATVALRRAGEAVAVTRSLLPDRQRLVLAASAPLAGAAAHEIVVGLALRDVFGRTLAAPFASLFTTVDTAPPPRPASGVVTLSMPLGGVTDVRGTPGAAVPGALVVARNLTQGTATSVVAGADGSFFLRVAAEASDVVRLLVIGAGGSSTDLGVIPFSDGEGGFMIGPEGGEAASSAGVVARLRPRALLAPALVRIADRAVADLEAPLPAGVSLAQGFRLDFDEALLNRATALEVDEAAGRFPQRGAFSPPLRIETTQLAPATTGLASRFTFTATSRDAGGAERVVAIEAEGRAAACNETRTVRDDAAAPALALTAPRCLGPEEAFTLRAEAVQPRVEVAAPRPAGAPANATWLVVRAHSLGSEVAWRVEERLTAADGAGPQVVTDPLAPFGLREPGGYWIVRAPSDLAWIEGRADGDVLVGAEGSAFVTRPADPGGAFLLPVPSGRPLVLRRLDAVTGAERSRRSAPALAAGETRAEARLGDDGLAALVVVARSGPGGRVHGRGPVAFEFSQPVSAASVTPTSVVVSDANGRAVAAERRLVGDGSRLEIVPERPWRFGGHYAYRVTTEVAGIGGARLAADQMGAFEAFQPSVVARVAGSDVRDAAVASPLAFALDAGRLRPLDLTNPSAPIEGVRLELGAATSRLLRHVAQDAPLLLAAGGGGAEYGAVQRIGITDPLRPVLAAARRLSTPEGASTLGGVDPRPGIPSALAAAQDAAVVATQGIGLQRLSLAGGLGPPPPEPAPSYPPGGATYAAVAGDEGLVASVSGAELAIHDPASLAPLATAAVTGSARDVVLARVADRELALVGAGLPGGVQAFAIAGGVGGAGGVGPPSPAQITKVAQVLPGCAVTRLAVDAPLQRAWFACTNGKVGAIDLAGADGLDPIDRDRDGLDDRIAGLVDLSLAPSSPLALDLDEGRALGLVSAGTAGLVVAQLGPAEALIRDVRRDVLPEDRDDESSIFATGRAFHGDQALVAHVEARIPPGHPGLRAVLAGSASLVFEGGAREIPITAGTQHLRLVPVSGAAIAAPFSIAIVEGTEPLAAFAGTVSPVPVDALVSVDGDDIVADGPGPHPVVISGVGADDVLYNLTPLARFELAGPEIGTIGADGALTATAGGESEIA